jgi:hypothetical protein
MKSTEEDPLFKKSKPSPAYILWLIREGIVGSMTELREHFGLVGTGSKNLFRGVLVAEIVQRLKQARLIYHKKDGSLSPTSLIEKIQTALNIRLC